jgi:hypothetical protein
VIGSVFPRSPFDTTAQESAFVYRIRGERFVVRRTETFRRYPFPEISRTNYIPEPLVGLQIGRSYKFRFVNEVFRIYYVDKAAGNLSNRKNVARGARGRLATISGYSIAKSNTYTVLAHPIHQSSGNGARGRSIRGAAGARDLRELETWKAKLLVLATCPLSVALIMFHALKVSQKETSRRIV